MENNTRIVSVIGGGIGKTFVTGRLLAPDYQPAVEQDDQYTVESFSTYPEPITERVLAFASKKNREV